MFVFYQVAERKHMMKCGGSEGAAECVVHGLRGITLILI